MLFKKLFYLLMFFFALSTISYTGFSSIFSIDYKYFDFNMSLFNNYNFSAFMDKNSMIFIFMVCLVTCFVCIYSEVYMEHYNNKKFFVLMLLFFSFMSILSLSGSFVILMLGWDGLGLSSICLIMFYPNKTTLFNSVMTMFFNRMGDVILIFILCKFLKLFSSLFFLNQNFNVMALVLLMICAFTKSAQFPLSSWLPAAMSAPTPISAMVHSSTLVTAGILLTQFMSSYFEIFGVSAIMSFFCLLTFLLGGLLGVLELDQKKIIAFSTMSQISMILFFCSFNLIAISLSHMVFHAFFKTMLFVASGMFFMFFFNKQMKNFMGSSGSNFLFLNSLIILSIYSMSGLLFSSSFYSKDLFLEILCSENSSFLFFCLLAGSIFTTFYSSKLAQSVHSFMNFNKVFSDKSFFFLFSILFLMFVSYSGQIYKGVLFFESFPNVAFSDVLLILVMLLFALLVTIKISSTNFFTNFMENLGMEIYLMKFFTYELVGSTLNLGGLKFLGSSDSLVFKKFYLDIYHKLLKLMMLKSKAFFSLMLLLTLFMFN